MKKIAAISFSAFYLIASIGVAVNFHYCLGRLESVNVILAQSNCCCDDEGQMMVCCDDESYFFQLDDEEKVVPAVQSFADILLVAPHFVERLVLPSSPLKTFEPYLLDLPPPKRPATWLLFCAPIHYA
ncbi:MAG: hypothetical protein AB8H47_19410 [Bacteroidia bacterium]